MLRYILLSNLVYTVLFDFIGALTSFISTYYFIKLNNKAWPIGMIATLLNGWLYWQKGIYADTLLEVFYFFSLCYGWIIWHKQKSNNKAQITLNNLSPTQWFLLTVGFCMVFLIVHSLLQRFTNSNIALLDATTTSLSLVAQWLMCHKIIFTWVLWFITDLLFAFMYLSKQLPFHCGLMLIYTGMAVMGYLVWARQSTRPKLYLALKNFRFFSRLARNQ